MGFNNILLDIIYFFVVFLPVYDFHWYYEYKSLRCIVRLKKYTSEMFFFFFDFTNIIIL